MQRLIALDRLAAGQAARPSLLFQRPVTMTAQRRSSRRERHREHHPPSSAARPGDPFRLEQPPTDENGQGHRERTRARGFKPRAIGSRTIRAPHTGSALLSMPLKAGRVADSHDRWRNGGHACFPRCWWRHGPGLRPLLPGGVAMSQAPEEFPNELTPAPPCSGA